MSQEDLLATIVHEVLSELHGNRGGNEGAAQPLGSQGNGLDPARDFPLATKRPDLVKTNTGRGLDEITLEAAVKGEIAAEELRITPETLELQAQIAEKVRRPQLARNLRRAAELTKVSDERILQIYNALRPYRSTKAELLAIADELDREYGAKINAAFIREATTVYEARGRLKQG